MEIKKVVKEFWDNNPLFYGFFKESSNIETARSFIYNYIAEKWKEIYNIEDEYQSLELDIQMNALRTMRWIFSKRGARLAGFNPTELLLNLAQDKWHAVSSSIKEGFFVELDHLFKATKGKSGIYNKEVEPVYKHESGRKAAVLRSGYLNTVAIRAASFIDTYKHGLDEDIIKKRKENVKRILAYFDADESNWNDYTWHLKNVIRDRATLDSLIDLTDAEKAAIDKTRELKLPFGITPYYVSLMDKESSRINDHAIRAQVIPPPSYVNTMEEYRDDRESRVDFMLERDTSPVDLITRRYPGIVIFKAVNTCSQICVYCQRNWQIKDVHDPQAMTGQNEIEKAVAWISENKEIEEVLITGGDPFILTNERLEYILEKVSAIDHVSRIRLGTRTPVALPQRITKDLVDVIRSYHIPGKREIAIVTHFEHVYEVTPEALRAVQMFKEQGLSVYNQAVFTLENSRRFELVALRKILRLIGVDSYYTFNTKGKEETNDYRVPIARLQQEINEESRLMPGLVRTDEAVYNVPRLGKNYVRAEQHHSLISILPDGRRVYEFHPWEKNLARIDTYIDIDVPINEYLKKLEARGEDIDDYKSIWYYY